MNAWRMVEGGFAYKGSKPFYDFFLLQILNNYEDERDNYRDRGIKSLIAGVLIGAASGWIVAMILLISLGLVF